MATVEEGLQAQIRNIEATYGKPMDEWLAIIAASGLTKHTEVVGMLKTDYGMTHGAAHRVSLVARQSAIKGPVEDINPGVQERPRRGPVRPDLVAVNVEGDVPAGGRLESATGFNALFTHRVRLAGPDGLDSELIGWLRSAYDRAG